MTYYYVVRRFSQNKTYHLIPPIGNERFTAGSSNNFRGPIPKIISLTSCLNRRIRVLFYWYPTDITLVLWSRFIYTPLLRIRIFDRTNFSQSLFPEGFPIEAEINFISKENTFSEPLAPN